MFIPPSVMEGSKPEYRPEPFAPAIPSISAESLISSFTTIFDSLDIVESQVSSGQGGTTWPVKSFHVKIESAGEIVFMLAASAFALWWCLAYTDFRRGLFVAPLPLWGVFYYLRALTRKISSDWHDSVRLDMDQLFRDRGNSFDQNGIRYQQICAVKITNATSKTSGPVEIKYYPYADQTGALNLARLKSLNLPATEDTEGLYNELRRRAFGPPPSRQAQIRLFVWGICQLGLVYGGILLYASILGRIGR